MLNFCNLPTSLSVGRSLRSMPPKRKVNQYHWYSCEKIKTFNSITEASKSTGIDRTGIIANCKGRSSSAGGFIWQYETNRPFEGESSLIARLTELDYD